MSCHTRDAGSFNSPADFSFSLIRPKGYSAGICLDLFSLAARQFQRRRIVTIVPPSPETTQKITRLFRGD